MSKTVNVRSPQALQLRLYRKALHGDMPMMPDPDHEPVQLRAGANAGIDAGFFAAWVKQNEQLAKDLGIAAEDEDEPESAKREEHD